MMRRTGVILAALGVLSACTGSPPSALPGTSPHQGGREAAPGAESSSPSPLVGEGGREAGSGGPTAPPATSPADARYIVELSPGATVAAFTAATRAEVLRAYEQNGRQVLSVEVPSGASRRATQARLAAAPGVRQVHLDAVAEVHAAPNDPRYNEQWYLHPGFMDVEGAWEKLGAAPVDKVIIGIVDTGVDFVHEDINPDKNADGSARANRIVRRVNTNAKYIKKLKDKDPALEADAIANVEDNHGHGTVTAGLVSAVGNNGTGIAGIAWNAPIICVKADQQNDPGDQRFNGQFLLSDVLAGLKFLHDNAEVDGAHLRVVNMSLGQTTAGVEPLYQEAVDLLKKKGVLVVASAGNNAETSIPPPASTPGVIAVGATSRYLGFEFLAPFSNHGPRLDLVAPGDPILATVGDNTAVGGRGTPQKGYSYAFGTSEAAPLVAGVAALVFAKFDPDNASVKAGPVEAAKMVDRVRAHLLASCDDLGAPGKDPVYGAGRLNARKALEASGLPTLP